MQLKETGEQKLLKQPVFPLVISYCVSGLIGLAFQAFQVASDGYLVGNGLGEIGLSTIGICVPLLSFAMAIGCAIGVGGTSLAAISLGKGDPDDACHIFGQCVWSAVFISIIIAVAGYFFSNEIAVFLGGSGELIAYCSAYIKRYMLFFPFYILGCVFYYFVRLDGKPFIATLSYVIPPLYAVAIEYFCIYHWDVGIASSSTSFGLCVGSWALCGLYFVFNKKTMFKLSFNDAKLNFKTIKDVLIAGIAAFSVQMAIALIAYIVNIFLAIYSTSEESTVFGVLNGYILYIFSLIVTLAFTPGLQPIASYNIGAREFDRVRKSLNLTYILCTVVMGIITVLVLLCSNVILTFFIGDNPELIQIASKRLLLYIGFFSLGGTSFVVAGYFQAIEKDATAVFVSLCRNVILLVPSLWIVTSIWGGDCLWYAFPACDIMAGVISLILIKKENERLHLECTKARVTSYDQLSS